jgi:signal transduction histidine kinase/CheY-like chemotaxis protein
VHFMKDSAQSRLSALLSRLPLWSQLALLALATAVPLLLAALIMFNRMAEGERTAIRQGLFLNAKTLASLVENEIDTHKAIVSTLAQSPNLLSDDLEPFRLEATNALNIVSGSWISVYSLDGTVLMSTLPSTSQPLPESPDKQFILATMKTGKMAIGDIQQGSIFERPHALVVVPVLRDGAPFRALSITLVADRFLELIKDEYTSGEVVGILDNNRKFVARIPDHENRVGTLASEGWRAAIDKSPGGLTENKTVEGDWSLTGYAPTRNGWTVGVAQLETAIQNPLRRIFWSSLALFAILSVLSLLLAFFIARNASKGMGAIADAAHEVGEGKRVEKVHAPFLEAAIVSQTLAKASADIEAKGAALSQANALLETKVAERTAQLQTELRRREEAEAILRQAQKIESLGQLTGGIAHDFNNMLTVVIGNLDTLKRRLPKLAKGGDLEKPVEAALQGARNAAKLTHRLLAFARKQPLEPAAINMNALVSGISDMLARTVGEPVKVETVLGAGLWTVFADPNQVESAIINLAVNARDAMPEGGKLTIETANAYLDEPYVRPFGDIFPGQYVMLSVSDTGIGIPRESMDRVFEPFFTTKGAGAGTGLGLAMVHGFVKQSGGHIRLYSEAGQGTSVKIYLPRQKGKSELTTTPKGKISAVPSKRPLAQGETVLLVEDDAGVRDYSAGVLKELGYRVMEAENAEHALDAIKGEPHIDIVFTDIVLGAGMNGRQLADAIKLMKPDLPILFTTGYTRNAIVHHGRLDPGVNFLGKPYTQRELAEKLRALLDGSKDPVKI